MINQNSPIFGTKRKLLLVRGILGGLSIICSFSAVVNLNLSIATVILSTSPILTGILSCIIDREKTKWSLMNTLSIITCFIGLFIISIKGFHSEVHNFLLGFLMALSSSFFSALVNVTINEIKDENTLTISLYSMTVCTLITFPKMIYEIIHETDFPIIKTTQLCVTGILSLIAQYLKTKSIQMSDNLGIIVFRYFDVIFSLLWDLLILKTTLYTFDYIGITCILIGCCMMLKY